MHKHLGIWLIVLALWAGSVTVALADLYAGIAAHYSGDFKTAFIEFELSAEQGVANAQSNLGVMYDNGTGALNDNVRAHMWYNVAGANGSKVGADNRVIIENKMTPAQIAEAQKMAREWMEKHP